MNCDLKCYHGVRTTIIIIELYHAYYKKGSFSFYQAEGLFYCRDSELLTSGFRCFDWLLDSG